MSFFGYSIDDKPRRSPPPKYKKGERYRACPACHDQKNAKRTCSLCNHSGTVKICRRRSKKTRKRRATASYVRSRW